MKTSAISAPFPFGPLSIARIAVGRLAILSALAAATSAHAQTPAPPPGGERPALEFRPYAVRAYVGFDLGTRVDRKLRDVVITDWLKLARRFVGPAWEIDLGASDSPATLIGIDEITPATAKPFAGSSDKVWFIHGRAQGDGLILEGREFDTATGWLGTRHEVACAVPAELPRALFRLAWRIFAPFAEIGEQSGGGVFIRVQASAIPAAQPVGEIVAPGTVFLPVRVFLQPDGSPLEVVKIPYSYLRVARMEGASIFCDIVRGIRDPLTKRVARKNKLIALGIEPAATPTRLRFVYDGNKTPAAGYLLTAKPYPTGPSRELGTTDREGRIELAPGFSDSLVRLRLLGGPAEPMVDIPLMPGETVDERTIPFIPRPLTLTLETRLDSLRDSIVDVVAARSRLERRMKARVESETPDWDDVEESLLEYHKYPPRSEFVSRLEKLESEARAEETRTKTLIITRTALNQINDTKALIDRYLDDELFAAYEDALKRARGAKGTRLPAAAVAAAPPAASTPAPPPAVATAAPVAAPSAPAEQPAPRPAAPAKPAAKPAARPPASVTPF
ncbi:MAG: hypothetical protein SFX72_21050 [Isosphaeraceae bacterium]|nr:hypothetical protein [Isosphaeraceae bacterium]